MNIYPPTHPPTAPAPSPPLPTPVQEWVRPGRFMLTLNALQQEMLQQAQGGGSDGGSDSSGGTAAPSGATLERLESVRREALQVLLEMAGEGQPYMP